MVLGRRVKPHCSFLFWSLSGLQLQEVYKRAGSIKPQLSGQRVLMGSRRKLDRARKMAETAELGEPASESWLESPGLVLELCMSGSDPKQHHRFWELTYEVDQCPGPRRATGLCACGIDRNRTAQALKMDLTLNRNPQAHGNLQPEPNRVYYVIKQK